MNDFKIKLCAFEDLLKKDICNWEPILEQIPSILFEYSDNVEVNIRILYWLHHILLEKKYTESERVILENLLNKYFKESCNMFSNNSEYLFFIGKILYIAEWYFGLNDDLKPLKDRMAFQMQKKAFDLDPDNKLYEWAYLFSENNNRAYLLSTFLLSPHNKYLEWLEGKGYPGEYIIETLEYCRDNVECKKNEDAI